MLHEIVEEGYARCRDIHEALKAIDKTGWTKLDLIKFLLNETETGSTKTAGHLKGGGSKKEAKKWKKANDTGAKPPKGQLLRKCKTLPAKPTALEMDDFVEWALSEEAFAEVIFFSMPALMPKGTRPGGSVGGAPSQSGGARAAKTHTRGRGPPADVTEFEMRALADQFKIAHNDAECAPFGNLQKVFGTPLRLEEHRSLKAYFEYVVANCEVARVGDGLHPKLRLPPRFGTSPALRDVLPRLLALCKDSPKPTHRLGYLVTHAKVRLQSYLTNSWLVTSIMGDTVADPPGATSPDLWNNDRYLELFVATDDPASPPASPASSATSPTAPTAPKVGATPVKLSIDLKQGGFTALRIMALLADPELNERLKVGWEATVGAQTGLESLASSRDFRMQVLGGLEHEYIKGWAPADVERRLRDARLCSFCCRSTGTAAPEIIIDGSTTDRDGGVQNPLRSNHRRVHGIPCGAVDAAPGPRVNRHEGCAPCDGKEP